MFELLSSFSPQLEALGQLVYWLLFLISFLESFAFVGLLIPGTTCMVIAGILSSQGFFKLGDLILMIALGGILGDTTSFYLGRRGASLFNNTNKIFKLEYLQKGENFFLKHGDKSIFFARFFGPLRPVVPFVAGMFKMSRAKFFFYTCLSAFCTAPLYLLFGYFFGKASEHIGKIIGVIGIFFVGFLLVGLGLFFFRRSLLKKGQDFFISLRAFIRAVFKLFISQPKIENFIERHPKGINFLKKRTSTFSFVGLPLTLFSIIICIVILTCFDLPRRVIGSSSIFLADGYVQNFLFLHRHSTLVSFFWFITYLGSVWVMVPVSIAVSLVILLKKKYEYFFPFIICVGGGVINAYLLKIIIAKPRPEEVSVYLEKLFSFPSLHSISAMLVYGFFAYFLIHFTKNWQTKLNIIFGSAVLILLIGFSRLYLGVHYFSDVIGGYILGALWLWFGISLVRFWRVRN